MNSKLFLNAFDTILILIYGCFFMRIDAKRLPNSAAVQIQMLESSNVSKILMNMEAGGPWPTNNGTPITIGCFQFSQEKLENGTAYRVKMERKMEVDGDFEEVPFVVEAPPEHIAGILAITVNFLNDQILEFIEKCAHLFGNVILTFDAQIDEGWNAEGDGRVKRLRRFYQPFYDKIFALFFGQNSEYVLDFLRIFPGLLDQARLTSLPLNKSAELDEQIFDWLLRRRNDGKLKFLDLYGDTPEELAFVDRFKQEFSNSTQPLPAVIRFMDDEDEQMRKAFKQPPPNEQTGEELILIADTDSQSEINWNYLVRQIKGKSAEAKEEGKKAIRHEIENITCISIGDEF